MGLGDAQCGVTGSWGPATMPERRSASPPAVRSVRNQSATTTERNHMNPQELAKPYKYAALVGIASLALTAMISLFS